MADSILVSGSEARSNYLYGTLLCVAAGAIAVWSVYISTKPHPAPRRGVENFIIRISQDSLEKSLGAARRNAPPTHALSENTACQCGGRPRAGSDPTGTVSRPEVFAERAANRMRKCMNICGAAAAKTVTTPAGPIIKGARSVLKGLSINEGQLSKAIEEECDTIDNATDADKEVDAGDIEGSDEAPSATSSRSRAASVAASTICVTKSPVRDGNPGLNEYSETQTIGTAESAVVETLTEPEIVKQKSRFRKITHKVTTFTARHRSGAQA